MIYSRVFKGHASHELRMRDHNWEHAPFASAEGASEKLLFNTLFFRLNIIFYNNQINLSISRTFQDFLIDFQDYPGLLWGPYRFPGLFQDFQDFQDSVRTLYKVKVRSPFAITVNISKNILSLLFSL